jgi:hypothetical protein
MFKSVHVKLIVGKVWHASRLRRTENMSLSCDILGDFYRVCDGSCAAAVYQYSLI